MTNENRQDTAVPEPGPAALVPDANTAPSATGNPWLDFLADDKASAKKFIGSMRKGAIRVPDAVARETFAQALVAAPGRMKRLLALMRESARAGDTISGIVFELAEAGIRHINGLQLPATPNEETGYEAGVRAWLDGQPRRPLKPGDLQVLLLLVLFGLHRRYLAEDAAMTLIASAVRPVPKRRNIKAASQRVQAPTSVPSPIDVVLAAPPAAPVLAALAAHGDAWQARADAGERTLRDRAAEIERLSGECARRTDAISELRATVSELEAAKAASEAKVADMEKQILDLSDGWQHKLDDIRGRIRGTLSGQFTRWVQTALDAARSDPPVAGVIEERLEDTLKLIERELKWLQPSA